MTAGPFVSYAQNAEDVVLARALHPDARIGFWIDVGAGDPVVGSVTAAFAERGWRGINIEPLPLEHELLSAARPNDVNLQVAVGAQSGQGTSITTLADIVAEHAPGTVDFLRIGVEGFEEEVLRGADWSSFRPRIIVAEATVPNGTRSDHERWEPILLEHGYRFAMFDGQNRFYASDEEPALCEAMRTPANVHDNFVPHVWIEQARRHRDQLASTLDEIAGLRNDLDTAKRLAAQALDYFECAQREAEDAQRTAAETQEAVELLRAEAAAFRDTRLYRYTSPMRKVYGALRHPATRRPPAAP